MDSAEEEEKISNDWDLLLDDLDFRDIPDIEGVDVPQTPLTQAEAEREALAVSICERYSLLEENRHVIKTIAYNDKYKKILDGICLDKMKLNGMSKEEEEAIIKINGDALIEKEDPRAFVISIRLEGKINLNALANTGSDINVMPYLVYKELPREEVQNVKKGITMLNHSKTEPIGLLSDVLCQVGVTTIIAKFLILDMPIDRDTLILVGRGFLHTCGGILNTIERITSTFDGICHQTFRAAQTSLDTAESDSDDEEEYAIKRNKIGAPIYGPKPARYLNCIDPLDRSLALQETMGTHDDEAGSSRPKRSRQYETVKEVLLPQVHHEFLEWEGCNRDAKSTNYWLIFVREENLGLSRSHTSTIKSLIFRVTHKMITYGLCQRTTGYDKIHKNNLWLLSMFDAKHQNGYANVAWLIARWIKRKGAGTQKESQICCGQFISKIARKCRVLTKDVVRSLSAPIYCRDLDTITLRDLIDSEGKLIPEDPQPGVPRVGIPRPPRASMQDLYQGVFEHMAGVYSVPLQGAYNPPGYAQPQYDQYYQQYPPPPPQYPPQYQQQQDDDE
ncbi:reverse transcriptase domain-containing protein [Tanacetum coccineum]